MEKFEREVASHPHVDHRIRRRFAALYAAGQLLVRYDIVPKECDRFMEAISTCYGAAIGLLPKAPPSPVEVIQGVFRFYKENRARFPGMIPRSSTKSYIASRSAWFPGRGPKSEYSSSQACFEKSR